MRMKVHNKGQVVIPATLRQELDIAIGDHLEVEVDPEGRSIVLRKPDQPTSYRLAGSLHSYAADRPFPSEVRISEALRSGLSEGA